MADITMCAGENFISNTPCQFRDKCYRHTAVKNEWWQSWFMDVPDFVSGNGCEYFWDNSRQQHHEE